LAHIDTLKRSGAVSIDTVGAELRETIKAAHDCCRVVRGHDLTAVLSLCSASLIGRSCEQEELERLLRLGYGKSVEVLEYVAPEAESVHYERMQAEFNERHAGRNMRVEIKTALRDSSRSTPEFLQEALAFVQQAPAENPPEEDGTRYRVPQFEENAINVAVLVARDGSPELRQEHDGWIKSTLGSSFRAIENETHRYRPEFQFNPQAFSFSGYVLLLKHEWNVENIRLLLEAASFQNPSASAGFKDAALVLAALDERLIRSILRCAFTARIVPARDWRISPAEQREQQSIECAANLATRVNEEIEWLMGSAAAEPQWPQFPRKLPSLRNRHYSRGIITKEEDQNEPVEQFDFEYYGAAQWLKAAEGLFDVATRPWLRDLAAYYRDWTGIANGAGIDKDEQIDGEPESWNEVYFKLAARGLPGLPPEHAATVMPAYFGLLPDETLFDNLKIFLWQADLLFFNQNLLSSEVALSIRTLAGHLIQSTRGWKWLQDDRTLSSEMHISAVVSMFYFNHDGGGLGPSKCYLFAGAIPRITPFLTVFEELALDCRCPLIGLLLLNVIEVAPTAAHLPLLISLGSAWMETYQESVQFWIEYQFGKRLCASVGSILSQAKPESSQADLEALDRLLSHLVRLGIPDARRAEYILRSYNEPH
jgi:hypothetical protein